MVWVVDRMPIIDIEVIGEEKEQAMTEKKESVTNYVTSSIKNQARAIGLINGDRKSTR